MDAAWQARRAILRAKARPLYQLKEALARVEALEEELKAMKATNGRIVFMNLQPQIKKVFDILKAIPTSAVFANIQELDRYLDSMQKKVR